jgi:hypothetical protein
MVARPLTWNTDLLPDGVIRVAFVGQGGIGSDGNEDGERMRQAIRDILAGHGPAWLVIDLCNFEYRCGDWIGSVPLQGLLALGRGRVCILTTGETAAALGSLWEFSKLGHLIPLVSDLREALLYLSGSRAELRRTNRCQQAGGA